jgi:flagella basal body P-ring formation protein FlgA
MSSEQIAATMQRVKDRKAEIDQKNPQILVIYTKKDISKGSIIKDDDVEERTVGATENHIPDDATHNRQNVVLKKAKNDMTAGQPICQHDLAPLVGN